MKYAIRLPEQRPGATVTAPRPVVDDPWAVLAARYVRTAVGQRYGAERARDAALAGYLIPSDPEHTRKAVRAAVQAAYEEATR